LIQLQGPSEKLLPLLLKSMEKKEGGEREKSEGKGEKRKKDKEESSLCKISQT